MKSPRFLMIYLLRTTTAAFASRRPLPSASSLRAYASEAVSSDASAASPSKPLLSSGHITYRLARASDIPQIQSCNLATLPENYNDMFYRNHMRQWPELALVCEYVPEGWDEAVPRQNDARRDNHREVITPLRDYLSGRARNVGATESHEKSRPQKEIVGYVLGKVEDRPILHPPAMRPPPSSRVVPLYDGPSSSSYARWEKPPPRWEKLGHVTSLAVHSHARRLGIASSLLRQLHYHLSTCYSAEAVGLHVRISNAAAVKLYVESLEYDVADIIPKYYGDGEDAYFMRKELKFWRDMNGVVVEEQPPSRQHPPHRRQQYSSRENSIPDWVDRDTRSNFFDDRGGIRDGLSPEERAWVDTDNGGGGAIRRNNGGSSSLGKVTRSFRTFLQGGEQSSSSSISSSNSQRRFVTHKNFRSDSWQQRPPWETGPESLRLPRYSKIVRPAVVAVEEENRSMRKRSFVNRGDGEEGAVVDGFEEACAVAASGTG